MTPFMWGFVRGDFTMFFCPFKLIWFAEFTPHDICLIQNVSHIGYGYHDAV